MYPLTTAEVQEIVKLCAKEKIPVVPYAAGTSLEGHTSKTNNNDFRVVYLLFTARVLRCYVGGADDQCRVIYFIS